MSIRELGRPLGNALALPREGGITALEENLFLSQHSSVIYRPAVSFNAISTETFIVPEGVYLAPLILVVGGGGGGGNFQVISNGGNGGNLRCMFNVKINPGDSFTLQAGGGRTTNPSALNSNILLNGSSILTSGATLSDEVFGGNGGLGGQLGTFRGGGGGGAGGFNVDGSLGGNATGTSTTGSGAGGGGGGAGVSILFGEGFSIDLSGVFSGSGPLPSTGHIQVPKNFQGTRGEGGLGGRRGSNAAGGIRGSSEYAKNGALGRGTLPQTGGDGGFPGGGGGGCGSTSNSSLGGKGGMGLCLVYFLHSDKQLSDTQIKNLWNPLELEVV